jgi:hypothetical protein
MIICPLSQDECSKRIKLQPKTAFLMTPSKAKRNDVLIKVISRLSSELKKQELNYIDGCSLVDLGDTTCKICSTMQGCAIGILFYHPDIQGDALSNMFWEMGMLQGWGRPVCIIANKKEDVPSDFVRDFNIFYENNTRYISKFKTLLTSFKDREKYYVDILADEAIKTADYEKAIKYYQEAFLISGNRQIISKMRKLRDDIKTKKVPIKLRTRLVNAIDTYQQRTKY